MSENSKLKTLRERVSNTRRLWKNVAILTGCAVVIFSLLGIILAEMLLDVSLSLPVIVREVLLAGIIGAFVYLSYRFIIKPLRKKRTERDVALNIEHQHPELEDRLVSSLQFGEQAETDPIASHLIDRLVADTAERTKDIDFNATVDRRPMVKRWGIVFATIAFCSLLAIAFPGPVNKSLNRIFNPWEKVPPVLSTELRVTPGDAKVLSGQNQEINAEALVKPVDITAIHYRQKSEAEEYEQVDMVSVEDESQKFVYEFFNLTKTMEYYVTGGDATSETYTVNVYEMPKITQIEVGYTYPEYTKLNSVVQPGDGNVRAVIGTVVQVRATTNKGIAEAILTMADKTPAQMVISEGRILTYQFTVAEDSKYTIELTCVDGFKHKHPVEYTVTALKDEAPKVIVTKPGRDIKATQIEEVEIVAEAKDDFGISRLLLKYSVNAKEEKEAIIKEPPDMPEKLTGQYTFFLEELVGLEPGDVIAYHAEAIDNNTLTGPSKGVSEIYFIDIRPFKQRYEEREAEAGQQQEENNPISQMLSGLMANQKRIMKATWKLDNSRPTPLTEKYESDVKTQGEAQAKLRDKTQKAIDEISSFMRTGMIEPDALNNFESAVKEMDGAAKELNVIKTSPALPHQHKALEHIAKALQDIPKILQRMKQGFNPEIAENLELNMENLQNQLENQDNMLDEQMREQAKEMLEQAKEMLNKQEKLTEQSKEMSREEQPSRQQMEQMAQQESQMSQQAAQMGQQLSSMAQSNQRVNQQAGQQMQNASQEMQQAAQNLQKGARQPESQKADEGRQNQQNRGQQGNQQKQQADQQKGQQANQGSQQQKPNAQQKQQGQNAQGSQQQKSDAQQQNAQGGQQQSDQQKQQGQNAQGSQQQKSDAQQQNAQGGQQQADQQKQGQQNAQGGKQQADAQKQQAQGGNQQQRNAQTQQNAKGSGQQSNGPKQRQGSAKPQNRAQQQNNPQEGQQETQPGEQKQADSQRQEQTYRQPDELDPNEALQMSAAKGAKAEENLEEAIKELEKINAAFTAEALKDAAKNLQRAKKQQEQLKDKAEQLEKQAERQGQITPEDKRAARRAAAKQRQVNNNLKNLKRDLEKVNENLKKESPEASKHVENALKQMQEDELAQEMQDAQQYLQWNNFEEAKDAQDEALETMSDMEDELQTAKSKLAKTEEEKLENTLEQLDKTAKKLDDMKRETEALEKNKDKLTQEQRERMKQLAQQQNKMRQRAEQMREQAKELSMQEEWNAWTHAMNNWRSTRTFRFSKYDMVISKLNLLKRAMEERLLSIREKKRLAQTLKEDVPPEYRSLVDRYYESLSK